jgi:hypothetical protein
MEYDREKIFLNVEVPEKEHVEKPTWTLAQCQAFLKSAKTSRFISVYLQIIYTGMRPSEALEIPEIDCHPDEG